jgi:hypothetical protein
LNIEPSITNLFQHWRTLLEARPSAQKELSCGAMYQCLVKVDNTTSEQLRCTIVYKLHDLCPSLNDLADQCFDGVGNMRSCYTGPFERAEP